MNVDFQVLPPRPQATLADAAFHDWRLPPDDDAWCEFRRVPEGIHLRFPALADFIVSAHGCAVRAIPIPTLDKATLDHLHLNQVLPLALSAQGIPVFHASGVEFGGGALAFLGVSGRGKSTLATHLALQGAPLITDDGLVLDWEDDHYRALPSHPSVRLWQDSQDMLIGTRLSAAPAVSYTSKVRFLADNLLPLSDGPRPLRRAYFLGEGDSDDIAIIPMSAAEAAVEWVKHSFLLDIGDKKRLASHFNQIGQLAALGISYRLNYPRRYEMLDEVRAALLANVAN